MIVRIFGAVCALLAVFLFGMWLTWPELPYNPSGFPIDRKFLALSLNGQPLMLRDAPNIATLEVRGRLTFRHRVGGTSLCNRWGGHITFLPGRRIVWRNVFKTRGGVRAAGTGREISSGFAWRVALAYGGWRIDSGQWHRHPPLPASLRPDRPGHGSVRVAGIELRGRLRRRALLAGGRPARRRRPASGKRLELRAARPVAAALRHAPRRCRGSRG